jgi:hypothetical protein
VAVQAEEALAVLAGAAAEAAVAGPGCLVEAMEVRSGTFWGESSHILVLVRTAVVAAEFFAVTVRAVPVVEAGDADMVRQVVPVVVSFPPTRMAAAADRRVEVPADHGPVPTLEVAAGVDLQVVLQVVRLFTTARTLDTRAWMAAS